MCNATLRFSGATLSSFNAPPLSTAQHVRCVVVSAQRTVARMVRNSSKRTLRRKSERWPSLSAQSSDRSTYRFRRALRRNERFEYRVDRHRVSGAVNRIEPRRQSQCPHCARSVCDEMIANHRRGLRTDWRTRGNGHIVRALMVQRLRVAAVVSTLTLLRDANGIAANTLCACAAPLKRPNAVNSAVSMKMSRITMARTAAFTRSSSLSDGHGATARKTLCEMMA